MVQSFGTHAAAFIFSNKLKLRELIMHVEIKIENYGSYLLNTGGEGI